MFQVDRGFYYNWMGPIQLQFKINLYAYLHKPFYLK